MNVTVLRPTVRPHAQQCTTFAYGSSISFGGVGCRKHSARGVARSVTAPSKSCRAARVPCAALAGAAALKQLVFATPSRALRRLVLSGRRWFTSSNGYQALTSRLVLASIPAALILAAQPLLQAPLLGTDAAVAAAAVAATAAEWQAPLRDMFAFTVLLSVFILDEPGAAAASAASAAGGALLLVTSSSPPLPAAAAATAALLAMSAAAVVLLAAAIVRQQRRSAAATQSERPAAAGAAAASLALVQRCYGVLGGGLLLQLLASLLLPGGATPHLWLPIVGAGAAAAAAATTMATRSKHPQAAALCNDWPAWSATLLLILQPLAQLLNAAVVPALLDAVCPMQLVLAALASGLMVPRALLRCELMWFTGTFSGAALALAQLAVLGVRHLTGCGCLPAVGTLPTLAMAAATLMLACSLLRAGWVDIARRSRAATSMA